MHRGCELHARACDHGSDGLGYLVDFQAVMPGKTRPKASRTALFHTAQAYLHPKNEDPTKLSVIKLPCVRALFGVVCEVLDVAESGP